MKYNPYKQGLNKKEKALIKKTCSSNLVTDAPFTTRTEENQNKIPDVSRLGANTIRY